MSVLWQGAEDIEFVDTGNTPGIYTGAGYFRVGYGRCALAQASEWHGQVFAGGAVTSAWLHFELYFSGVAVATTRFAGLVKHSTTNSGIWIGAGDTTAGKLTLYKWNGTTLTKLAEEAGTSLSGSTLYAVDMNVASYGASSTITVYLDGTQVFQFTGDCSVSGVSDLDAIGARAGTAASSVCELIAADEDTRGWGLVTLFPNGAGDSNALTGTGGTWDAIDEIGTSATDYVSGTGDGLFALSGLPAGTFTIKSVMLSARAKLGTFALGVKTNGTINVGGDNSLTSSYATVQRLLATNPVTSSAWTPTEIGALQLALRCTGTTVSKALASAVVVPITSHTITASAGAHGSISPSGATEVDDAADQSFTFTPAAHYAVADVLVDGESVGAVASYTFENVTADHTISVSFALLTHTITASAGSNGSVSPSGATTVTDGDDLEVTFTPDSHYAVEDVLVDGVSQGGTRSYTFSNVTASHTISATFAPATTGELAIELGEPLGGEPVASAAPVIDSFDPASGAVGSVVTLHGSSFNEALSVTFDGGGGTAAVTFTVAADDTLLVIVPVGASSGTITVTGPLGSGTSAGSYTIVAASARSTRHIRFGTAVL